MERPRTVFLAAWLPGMTDVRQIPLHLHRGSQGLGRSPFAVREEKCNWRTVNEFTELRAVP